MHFNRPPCGCPGAVGPEPPIPMHHAGGPEPLAPVPPHGGVVQSFRQWVKRMFDRIGATKADKAAGATEGNLAALDENGNPVDSGVPKDGVYLAPEGGIPKTDLASDVQASLGKADTALQEHQDISGKAEKSEMSVTPGTGADADKTTIQLKSGTSATVLVAHQDISGKADLVDGTVPSSQLPSYVDDVLEYASASAFPATGEAGKIYIAIDTNVQYRWSGTQYSEIAKIVPPSTATPAMDGAGSAGSSNAYARGDHRHPTDTTRASKADATLSERTGFSGWTITAVPEGVDPTEVFVDWGDPADRLRWYFYDASDWAATENEDPNATVVVSMDGHYKATRTALAGYQLGGQTSKPLASEAEAEALRTAVAAKYAKPSGGIPKTDMAAAVQTALSKIDAIYPVFIDDEGDIVGMLLDGYRVAWGYGGYIEFNNNGLRFYHPSIHGGSVVDYTLVFPFKGGTIATVDDLPYSLGTPTIIDTASSETVEGETVYYGAATLADRTANIVGMVVALDELRVTIPPAVSGKVRDFGLYVAVGSGEGTALAAPALVPVAPTGETITIMNAEGEMPTLADGTTTKSGTTVLYFTEVVNGVFLVKGEQVEEVA